MSGGLPVGAEQLWVAGGVPQGRPDGSYPSLAPHQAPQSWTPVTHMQTFVQYYNSTKHISLETYKQTREHTLQAVHLHISHAGNRYADTHTAAGKQQFQDRRRANLTIRTLFADVLSRYSERCTEFICNCLKSRCVCVCFINLQILLFDSPIGEAVDCCAAEGLGAAAIALFSSLLCKRSVIKSSDCMFKTPTRLRR